MTRKKQPNRLREAINEMADGMHRLGVIDEPTFRKITARQLGATLLPTAEPITGEEIRRLREQAHLSQAALGRYIGVTTGYVSQLERGAKQAKGPALALLNVIRRRGIEVVF